MNPRVRKVSPLPGYKLEIVFSNNEQGLYDCSRLLDFGMCPEATNPNGPPVLVVPSLINRAYILDLNENCSLLRCRRRLPGLPQRAGLRGHLHHRHSGHRRRRWQCAGPHRLRLRLLRPDLHQCPGDDQWRHRLWHRRSGL